MTYRNAKKTIFLFILLAFCGGYIFNVLVTNNAKKNLPSTVLKKQNEYRQSESPVDFQAYANSTVINGIQLERISSGSLTVSSGSLLVSDPFYIKEPFSTPLTKNIPPGKYPVFLSVLNHPSWSKRVAFLRVEIAPKKTVRWEKARQTPPQTQTDDETTYDGTIMVDSGLISVMDAKTGSIMASQMDTFQRDNPKGSFFDQYLENLFDPDGLWAVFTPQGSTVGNSIIVSSGIGDGAYNVYWGFDDTNAISELIIDFQLFENGKCVLDS